MIWENGTSFYMNAINVFLGKWNMEKWEIGMDHHLNLMEKYQTIIHLI